MTDELLKSIYNQLKWANKYSAFTLAHQVMDMDEESQEEAKKLLEELDHI